MIRPSLSVSAAAHRAAAAALAAVALALVPVAVTPASAASQVTGDGPSELQLTPADHGRLIDPLVTEEERREWHALANPAAREAFLERFWQRRDPTPGTPENEFRDLFMRRAARAASLFGGEDTPGWATPRGRALLVYGLPDEQERRATGEEPELRWTWSDAPGSLTVRFAPVAGERWAFQGDAEPELDWEAFAANARERLRLPVGRAAFDPDEGVEPDAEAAEGDGEAEVVEPPPMPPETVAWLRMVRDGEVRRDFRLEERVYFFPAPDGTYVLVGFSTEPEALTFEPVTDEEEDDEEAEEAGEDVDEGAEGDGEEDRSGEAADADADPETRDAAEPTADRERAELRAFGGILGAPEGEAQIVHQFNIPFSVTRSPASTGGGRDGDTEGTAEEPPEAASDPGSTRADDPDTADGLGVRSFGVTLTPGTYRLAWGVMDTLADRMSLSDRVIRVPAFGDGLQLSSVILARPPHSEAEETMSVAEIYDGLRLGSSLLDADLSREFGRDETFEVVFIVDGWQEDESAPGRPRLEVGYRILVVEADEGRASIARLPVQELSFHAVGQEIPLSQIQQIEPGGSYELEISVRDLVTNTRVVEIVPFTVAPDVEGPEER